MPMFRKRPVVIEARRVIPIEDFGSVTEYLDASIELSEWCGGICFLMDGKPPRIDITTLEGVMSALPGDWIIKGVKGEFYPCKSDIFEASYEEV